MTIAREIFRRSGFSQEACAMMNGVFDDLWDYGPHDENIAVILAESIVSAVTAGYSSRARVAHYAQSKLHETLCFPLGQN